MTTRIKSNQITEIISDQMKYIKELFKKTDSNHEFEFIFFTKKGKYLSQEKYIQLLKFISNRTQINDKLQIVGPIDTLDIILNEDSVNVRCIIEGSENITSYMKNVNKLKNHEIFKSIIKKYKKKKPHINLQKKEKTMSNTIDIEEFDFRVRLSKELGLTDDEIEKYSKITDKTIKNIIFRIKQRTTLFIYGTSSTKEFIKVDITYTKTSNNYNQLNLCIPHYELEIEFGTNKEPKLELLDVMFDETELLYKVIQQGNNIICNSEIQKVLAYYKSFFVVDKSTIKLAGRETKSLEIPELIDVIPNKYAVTDKADGERNFLIVCNSKAYLIDKNLNIKNTGLVVTGYDGTVVDGELIFLPNHNRHIYLIFDCLYHKQVDIRPTIKLIERLNLADDFVNKCFIFDKQKGYKIKDIKMSSFDLPKKLNLHKEEIKMLMDNLNHDIKIEKQKLLIRRKYFIFATGAHDWEIHAYANLIYNSYVYSDINCPYHLDGLIFQPSEQAYLIGKDVKYSDLKWKPPEKNSIDFYIEFEKDINNKEIIAFDNSYEKFEKNKPYKICKLHVGNNTKGVDVPVLFREKQEHYYAHLFLEDGEVRDVDGDIISDKTVVEFYYNNNSDVLEKFRWVPLRTRYDKTEMVLKFKKQYGNNLYVANNVWRTIINPILMSDFGELAKGNETDKKYYAYDKKVNSMRKKIENDTGNSTKQNAYFQKRLSIADPMKQFVNWIKSNMIHTYCNKLYKNNKQSSVLDLACGKGQDSGKFYYSNVSSYVGIDIDREGLTSSFDGAVARYEKQRKIHADYPKMFFMQADAGAELDIDSQKIAFGSNSIYNEQYLSNFFSKEPKKRVLFDVINCQLAMHYMLKNIEVWTNFKNNINNYLRNGGFFMATTFDGQQIKKLLGENDNYSFTYTDNYGKSHVLFDIVKKYNDDDETHLGNPINVYISWFSNEGRYLTEYLVDKDFIIGEFDKDCNMELVDTDSLGNQYDLHKDFFTKYVKHEETSESYRILNNVSKFYEDNDINIGSKIWNSLFRFYVFKKRDSKIHVGGGILDFTDSTKYFVPQMTEYDNNYSFFNSIHHILRSQKVIPKSLPPQKLYKDLGILCKKDIELDNVDKIAKKIIIEHDIDGDKLNILNGLNMFIIERNDKNTYDINYIKKNKKLTDTDKSVILLKEGYLYSPLYHIDPKTNKNIGFLNSNSDVVKKLLKKSN
jgi:SAM-dependent methyltransferase